MSSPDPTASTSTPPAGESAPARSAFTLRPLHDGDRAAYSEMVHGSFNAWYWRHGWGARNVETHLFQVRGEFQPFAGVSLPSFLPETG